MHRIDGAGNSSGMFVSENTAMNRPPTEITPEIMNAFQEEIAHVIEWAGLVLNKSDNTQLKKSLLAKFALLTDLEGLDRLTQSEGDSRYILKSDVDETGKRVAFLRTSAPNGYIKANGLTIGSATSGATNRANADAWPLFLLWWNEFDNTVLHIQDSAGNPTARGASAAADWTANKRLPTFDYRGVYGRGWDDERGLNPTQSLGEYKEDQLKAHAHGGVPFRGSDTDRGSGGSSLFSIDNVGDTESTGGSETTPKSIAELYCIKL